MAKHYPKGLDERMRDRSGEIRKKRSDTLVSTLRQEYGADFAKGYRPNTKLGAALDRADALRPADSPGNRCKVNSVFDPNAARVLTDSLSRKRLQRTICCVGGKA